jgi:lipid A 3-O-deacylase
LDWRARRRRINLKAGWRGSERSGKGRIVTGLRRPAALAALLFASAVLAPRDAVAQTGLIDEVKIGVLYHDIGFLGHHVETGQDANLEVLFTSPSFLRIIGSPRPDLGADINDAGNTSDAYFGLTWTIKPLQLLYGGDDRVFLSGSLGGAYQTGYIDHAPPGRKRLGSPVLFHLSAELGYQLTPVVSVSAYLGHISNANTFRHNAGITSAGARLGFKF